MQESKHKKTDRGIYFVIKKKESGPYWSRLLNDAKKVSPLYTTLHKPHINYNLLVKNFSRAIS